MTEGEDALIFDRVSRSFGAHRALEDVSFSCQAGQITCLVGPNGAGKSTALAMAAGMLKPSSGRISIAGAIVDGGAARSTIGFLPQGSAYPDGLTVEEVMRFSLAARGLEQAATDALLTVTGLRSVIDRRIGELSGGWARRLGIYVALLPGARVLLLDEPFVGIEPGTLDQLVDHLRGQAASGTTILVSSHDFEMIDRLEARLLILAKARLLGAAEAGVDKARDTYRRVLAQSEGS